MQYALNYSGTRFLSTKWWCPGGLRLNSFMCKMFQYIYTLIDFGRCFKQLIGSLSRATQQHSRSSHWMMHDPEDKKKTAGYKLGVLHKFQRTTFENTRNPSIEAFEGKKRPQSIQNRKRINKTQSELRHHKFHHILNVSDGVKYRIS